jgi:hypothetical protein
MSLSEHEAEFSGKHPPAAPEPREPSRVDLDETAAAEAKEAEALASDPMRRYREIDAAQQKSPRHKAASQKASPEDVKEIQALTVTLREKEAELARVKPGESLSPRVAALKRQIRGIEADLADAQPRSERVIPSAEPEKKANGATSTGDVFNETEPKLEDFAKDEKRVDPYGDWMLARSRWDRKKEAWDAKQTEAVETAKQSEDQLNARHHAAAKAFEKTHPDYFVKVADAVKSGHDLPPVVIAAIRADDKGPELLYALLGQPDEMDRLLLTMSQTPVTASSVVAMRRELTRVATRGAAGTSGAAPVARRREAPPAPITPVRTGPVETGDDEPGDEASLAAHEAAFHRRRR